MKKNGLKAHIDPKCIYGAANKLRINLKRFCFFSCLVFDVCLEPAECELHRCFEAERRRIGCFRVAGRLSSPFLGGKRGGSCRAAGHIPNVSVGGCSHMADGVT